MTSSRPPLDVGIVYLVICVVICVVVLAALGQL